ncbi:MAG: hypothetical protein A2808_02330 [Candidatus Moranbacteria bacterium RIFCSPHIGHO2_01_FULL_55_24]|nr:MAG: hypothetical protein A2808_02330 [Candidatus Moranbacteria bacterium RIFCSPHIGHO2_01_FULL_55_24]
MKTLLNLLPEGKKEENQRNLHGRFLLWQLFLLFLLEIFFLTILIGIYLILDFQLKSIHSIEAKQTGTSLYEENMLRQFEQKFRGTNEAIDVVGKFDATHLYFSQVFRLLDREQPAGIVLRQLSTKDYTVTLAGTAAVREDLLLFDERLKASSCISRANVPLSNLFSQKNIDFQIDFDIKPECLRQNSL